MSSTNDTMVEPLLDLQGLAAGVRRRRRMWAGLALGGLVAGVLAGTVLSGASAASAQIYVVHESEQSGDTEAMTKADLALLKSTSVAREAIAREPVGEPAEDYVEQYSGEVVAMNVLSVTAPGADDQQAVARARALADAFIAVYVRQTEERVRAEVRALDDRRKDVQRELVALGAGAATPAPGPPGRAERVSALNAQLSAIEQRAVEAEIGTPTIAAGTTVIDEARVTSRSRLFSAVLYGLIGLVAGLGGGLALAAVATVARDRPVLRRDIAAHLGASVIAQIPGSSRVGRRGARARAERRRVAGILARLVSPGTGPVSLLELGCAPTTAELVRAMALEVAAEGPVVVVDDLPGAPTRVPGADVDANVTIVSGGEAGSRPSADGRDGTRALGAGSVSPGASWTDLRRLGAETILVVRAGAAEVSWLHTVARQLADEAIAVIGVVVVRPDPRDRSDGTLWDPLHTAVRGRVAARASGVGADSTATLKFPVRVNGFRPPAAVGAPAEPAGRAGSRAAAPAQNGAPVARANGTPAGPVNGAVAPEPAGSGGAGGTAAPGTESSPPRAQPGPAASGRPSPRPRAEETVAIEVVGGASPSPPGGQGSGGGERT